MKEFVFICLRLPKEVAPLIAKLKKEYNITQIEIFMQGLALCQKTEYRSLKPPARLIKRAKEICKNV